ncbi:putative oxidoreductase YghA [Sodalis praecaptivus]
MVTGADSGIGRAAAIAFAREGADVALAYHPSEHKDAEQVAELVKEAGRKVVLLPGDLRDESVNVKVVEDALNQLGGLDILALVAGKQTAVEDIADLTTEQFCETFETNVFSLFWMTKAALPHLPPALRLSLHRQSRHINPARRCWITPRPKPPS